MAEKPEHFSSNNEPEHFHQCDWFSFFSSVLVSLRYLVKDSHCPIYFMPLLSIMNGYFRGHAEGSQFHDDLEEVTQLLLLPNSPYFSQSIQKILYSQGSCLNPLSQACWTESTKGPFLAQKIQDLLGAVWVFQSS